MEGEKMSHKITCTLAAVLFGLGAVCHSAVVNPAKAAFWNFDGPAGASMQDNAGNLYYLQYTGTCYYYLDNHGNIWAIFPRTDYYYTGATSAVPLVFGTLRNISTNLVWDGGYAYLSYFLQGYYRGSVGTSCY